MRDRRADSRLAELMAAYQQGATAAFDELYHGLKPRLYPYLLSLTCDPSRADDLLQETFLQLHRSRRTYQPGKPLLPWVFAIARYVDLMDRRSRFRRKRHLETEPTVLELVPVPPEAEQLASRQLLQQALMELGPDQREALLLNQVWGFTFEEIGGILGIRPATAKLRAYRGMQRLRRRFETSGNQDRSDGK